jgi:sigma-B regulation protein RsbU (phosphoserine phosphatase)
MTDNSSTLVSIDASNPFIAAMSARKKEATIYDIIEDPAFEDIRGNCMGLFEKLDATLMVPLIFEDKLTGILALGCKKSGKFYRPEDINLLNTLANQGAIAIENARMIKEVIEKERMEEELSIAHDMQMSMLPEECPQIEGADMAAFSQPAREVGGDFYDFLVTDDGMAGIVIGDVTGKSVSGALVMSASRSIFRMLAEENLSVRDIMIRANRRAKQDTQSGMFIALLYAHLNPAARTVTLCSAGQTQPILCTAADRKVQLVETQGDTFPLGIIGEVDYQETSLQMAPGDCLILYTDGIVEAENENGEMLGFDRLLDIVAKTNVTGADQILKTIVDEVNRFVGDAPQHDDLTVIAIKFA